MTRLTAAALILLAAAARPPTEAERIKKLPEKDRRWLTEFVAPIIQPEERKTFLELTESYQREFFQRDFWERREQDGLPWPLGPGYRQRYGQLRRLADEKYGGWNQDAGRMVLRWGEPDSVLSPRCASEEVFLDLEVWTYALRTGPAAGRHIFYRPAALAPRRLWTMRDELISFPSEKKIPVRHFEPPFKPNSCRSKMQDLAADCGNVTSICPLCPDLCEVFRAWIEIRTRQGSAVASAAEEARLFDPVRISTEGLDRQKARWATASSPGAKPIGVAPTPTVSPTPAAEPVRPLTDEEIRERILHLERKYRDWLDVAIPMLTREDLERFLRFSPAEKDAYIRDFWKKRK